MRWRNALAVSWLAARAAEISCWNEVYQWKYCCSELDGPKGNANCWGYGLTAEACCTLSPRNGNVVWVVNKIEISKFKFNISESSNLRTC